MAFAMVDLPEPGKPRINVILGIIPFPPLKAVLRYSSQAGYLTVLSHVSYM